MKKSFNSYVLLLLVFTSMLSFQWAGADMPPPPQEDPTAPATPEPQPPAPAEPTPIAQPATDSELMVSMLGSGLTSVDPELIEVLVWRNSNPNLTKNLQADFLNLASQKDFVLTQGFFNKDSDLKFTEPLGAMNWIYTKLSGNKSLSNSLTTISAYNAVDKSLIQPVLYNETYSLVTSYQIESTRKLWVQNTLLSNAVSSDIYLQMLMAHLDSRVGKSEKAFWIGSFGDNDFKKNKQLNTLMKDFGFKEATIDGVSSWGGQKLFVKGCQIVEKYKQDMIQSSAYFPIYSVLSCQ